MTSHCWNWEELVWYQDFQILTVLTPHDLSFAKPPPAVPPGRALLTSCHQFTSDCLSFGHRWFHENHGAFGQTTGPSAVWQPWRIEARIEAHMSPVSVLHMCMLYYQR